MDGNGSNVCDDHDNYDSGTDNAGGAGDDDDLHGCDECDHWHTHRR